MATLVPSLILLTGVVDDILTKKVHNKIFVATMILAVAYCLIAGGLPQLGVGLMSMLTAFVILLPMVVLKILGAGDLKIMLAFGLATAWQDVLSVVFFSFIWAVIFGLVKATLDGKLVSIFKNVRNLLSKKEVESASLHRIPYTVPLFFGWMSHLVVNNGRWI